MKALVHRELTKHQREKQSKDLGGLSIKDSEGSHINSDTTKNFVSLQSSLIDEKNRMFYMSHQSLVFFMNEKHPNSDHFCKNRHILRSDETTT